MNLFTTKEKYFLGFSVVAFIAIITFILAFPLITLWSINTLIYPLFSIPYSWSTYFAMLVINWIVMGSKVHQLSKIKEKL